MVDTRIVLSGLWVATMLTYLWGDVLRIFAGDVNLGELDGVVPTQRVWLGIAALMLVPIVMLVLALTIPYPAIRWVNTAVCRCDQEACSCQRWKAFSAGGAGPPTACCSASITCTSPGAS